MSTRPGRRHKQGAGMRPPSDVLLLERQIQAINRFPDQNPHPVMRMTEDGFLTYANTASLPIRQAWGAEVGEHLPAPIFERLMEAATRPEDNAIEFEHEHRTYSVLAVAVPDLGFVNLYGTDVTARQAINKFPDQNPHPVLRVDGNGVLLYANRASQAIVEALRIDVGQAVPAPLRAQIGRCLADRTLPPIELRAADLVFELLPVAIPEFGFTNLYGTDVTAARQVAEANRENERLLLNILPPEIARRLRRGEHLIADRFDDASIVIADMVGFTAIASRMTPRQVVEMLNRFFGVCDELVERHGLEKVKTIGDSYMVVGGVPTPAADHVQRVADFALDLAAMSAELAWETQVRLRIGIHAGPIAAGVIGVKKFIWDVWGDTVNQAARMETLGVPGRVHVTDEVRRRLAGAYHFEARGALDVKGKGRMPTYFLAGRLAERA